MLNALFLRALAFFLCFFCDFVFWWVVCLAFGAGNGDLELRASRIQRL